MSSPWFQRSLLLPVAQQVRRDERAGGQAAQGAGGGEHAAEEAAGRAAVREQSDQGCAAKKVVSAPARRVLVREWIGRGAGERRALAAIGMSASAPRYFSHEDRNVELRERVVTLAHRHRRYGVGMIYLKLRQEGRLVNDKRVERLYREQQLQVRPRKRKKVPVSERQPLLRPSQANQVWSMDVVSDSTSESRVIECLVIVDDATHEAVTIEEACAECCVNGIWLTAEGYAPRTGW
ncbi:transposase [Xanthomonas oryzae pv. oryzae]|nr:transposase [Xanthomonas oryzae pv. oryzae]